MYDLGRLVSGFIITLMLVVTIAVSFDLDQGPGMLMGGLLGGLGGWISCEWAYRW